MTRREAIDEIQRLANVVSVVIWPDGSVKAPEDREFFNKVREKMQKLVSELEKA